MSGTLGKALRNKMNKRRVEQKIKRGDITSRNRDIESFAPAHTQSNDLSSHCEINSIDHYLSMVSSRNNSFVSQKEGQEMVIVESKSDLICQQQSLEDAEGFDDKIQQLNDLLQINRRPAWKSSMTAEELRKEEENAFIAWKKDLSLRFSESKLAITPYEKNLEIWRQLWRVVEKSDILAQIVDARNPLLFRSLDLFKYTKEIGADKETFLLINKSDFLTDEKRRFWAICLKKKGVLFAFFSAKNASEELQSNLESKEMKIEKAATILKEKVCKQTVMSGRELLEVFEAMSVMKRQNFSLEKLIYRDLTPTERATGADEQTEERVVIGLVGYPNVGKSSVINVLFGVKKVSVGIMPGKTKHFQTLNITENVQLCDCPGLVFPSLLSSRAELICSGIISVEHSKNLLDSAMLVCKRVPLFQLMRVYKGINFPANKKYLDHTTLLRLLASNRGWFTACREPNYEIAARHILKDYIVGDLLYCFPPPGLSKEDKSAFFALNFPVQKSFVEGESLMERGTIPINEVFDERLGGSKKKHLKKVRGVKRSEWKVLNGIKRSDKAES